MRRSSMKENTKRYQCPNCGWTASEEIEKEHLEHCPNCLSGIHETDREGNPCGGILEPVSVWIREDDKWKLFQDAASAEKWYLPE